MKKTAYSLRFLALLLTCFLLWGCAGPEGSSGGSSLSTTPSGDVPSTVPAEKLASQESESVEAFGLSFYSGAGFNPYNCTKLANRAIMSLLYQRLFIVTTAYGVEKDLCRDYTCSDDLMTYTITLNNATFVSGETVTANDVVASIQAARGSDVYGSRFYHVSSIEATDPYTLVITLSTPCENLPMLLDVPIVRASDVDAERPMGSGPYAMRGFGTDLRLERRLDWSGSCAISAKNIPLYAATSTTEVRDSFEFGYTAVSYTDPGFASYVDYRCDYELYDCPTGIMLYLGCNLNYGLFSDPDIRAALTFAIDRNGLLAARAKPL